MFLQQILQQRLNALNEEEEKYLSAAGAGVMADTGKMSSGSLLAGTGANIMATTGYGAGKTIGSVHNGQLNYSMEHTFFNADTHTYPKARVVREVVRDEIDRDLLGAKPAKWTASVSLPRYDKIGEDLQKLQEPHKKFMIKQGFADETYSKPKPQTTYGGCDTRDVYYHGWDVSYEKTPPRDKERQYQIERAFLLDKTARTADNMLAQADGKQRTVYGIQTNTHMKPMEISMAINDKLRCEKDDEVALWKDLLDKARYDMPAASEQKLRALVYKQIQQIKHGKVEEADPELTFKPDCARSQKSKAPAPAKQEKRIFTAKKKAQEEAKRRQQMQEEADSSDA